MRDSRSPGQRRANEVLALPIYPEMTDTQLETVVDAVAAFYQR